MTPRRSLQQQIAADLERSATEGSLPERLTLQSVAASYGVSLTPVRAAIRELLRRGVLRREGGGRLAPGFLALPTVPGERREPPPATDLAGEGDWRSSLREEVLLRGLRGEAEFLREEATARRYGVGRALARLELTRLAAEGLLEHLPRRGWRVRVLDAGDMVAYLEVREVLELKALELARPHLDPARLRSMLQLNQGEALDNSLHEYLLECADNPYLREFFQRSGQYYSALFNYAAPATRMRRTMAAQHRGILEALIEERWEDAAAALSHHVRSQRAIVGKLVSSLRRDGAGEHAVVAEGERP